MPLSDRPVRTALILAAILAVGLVPRAARSDPDAARSVLTQRNDAARDGVYGAEATLTPAAVATGGLALVATRKVDGLISAQPLYIHGLTLWGRTRNVVIVATRDARVYAFDADDTSPNPHSALLWKRDLTKTSPGTAFARAATAGLGAAPLPGAEDGPAPCWQTRGPVGVLSTPVIDLGSNTLYVVYRTGLPPDSDPAHLPPNEARYRVESHHYLAALDVRTGAFQRAPVEIAARGFYPEQEMNRPALLLQNGTLYIGFASPNCDGGGNPFARIDTASHGWLFAYRATDFARLGAVDTAPRGGGAGIWQSGNGLAGDGTSVFAFTGNNYAPDLVRAGAAQGDRGESILKFTLGQLGLQLTGAYRPQNWYRLDTGDVGPPNDNATFGDSDLGSGGPVLLPNGQLVGGGKQGRLYVVDTRTLGLTSTAQAYWNTWHLDRTQPPCNEHVKPKFFTATCYIDSSNYDESQQYGPNIHGNPVAWHAVGADGSLLYAMPEKDYLRAYRIDPNGTIEDAPVATSQPFGVRSPDGMPGAMLSLSASGGDGGVLWASYVADADATNCPKIGDLRAFDALTLAPLWSAPDAQIFAIFTMPTIADGKVFRPTFGNQLAIYALHTKHPPSLDAYGTFAPGQPVTAVWSNRTHLDLFAIDRHGRVISSYFESDRQSDWFGIDPVPARFSNGERVTAVWRSPEHLDLFAADGAGDVVSNWWEGARRWQSWFAVAPSSIRVVPRQPVTAVWNGQHLDLFAADVDGAVKSTFWEPGKDYVPWFTIGPPRGLVSPGQPVTAVWRSSTHLDLYAVDIDGFPITTSWEAQTRWRPWSRIRGTSLRSVPGQPLTAVWSTATHLDLFLSTAAGTVASTFWEPQTDFVPWFEISPESVKVRPGQPIAARWAIWPGLPHPQLDLFAADTDGNVVSTLWTAAEKWRPWFVLSGPSLRAQPGAFVDAVYSRTPPLRGDEWPHLDLFVTDGNGEIAAGRFDRSGCGWQPFVERS